MSGAIKKLVKKVKKVFKKIVKVVKKVVSSKLFKVAVVAAAIYFGGAALLAGGIGAGGAAAAAPITSLSTAAAGATTAASTAATVSGASAVGAAGATATTAAATGAGGGLLSGLTSGKALLANTALNMGGSVLQGMAAAKQEKEQADQIRQNNKTELNVYDNTMDALTKSGWRNAETGDITSPQQRQDAITAARQESSIRDSNSAMSGVSASAQESFAAPKKPAPNKFYDNASNKWQKVKST